MTTLNPPPEPQPGPEPQYVAPGDDHDGRLDELTDEIREWREAEDGTAWRKAGDGL